MSFIGTGSEDWPEFDIDGIELDARLLMHSLVEERREQLERLVRGPFELEDLPGGRAYLVVDGDRKVIAQVTASRRLMITRLGESDLL